MELWVSETYCVMEHSVSIRNFRLLIQYDGSRYAGWQRLKNAGTPDIQGKIEEVLSRMLDERVALVGSGRTDAGVHALGQVTNFRTRKTVSPADIVAYANRYLPDDISVQKCDEVPESFHARFSASAKTYVYRIWREDAGNPFLRKYTWHVPGALDVPLMERAAQYLIGRHDFASMTHARKKDTEREIYSITIETIEGEMQIRFRGDGFLHGMVRILVGTLVAAGSGQLDPADIAGILADGKRVGMIVPAPAQGLFLESVEYSV